MKRPSVIVAMACIVLAGVLLTALLVAGSGRLCSTETLDTYPPVDNDGKPWRIGYYEGGHYRDYPRHLVAFIHALAEMGWIEPVELADPAATENDRTIWNQLVHQVRSPYIRFEAEAFWSAGWDETRRTRCRREALTALNRGAVDFMIAMGTQAGLDLRDGHRVPTTVVSSTDPIQAGIVDSVADSGRDHLHAQCDPTRHYRQIRVFHNITRFNSLGVLRDDSPESEVYAHLPDLRKAAKKMGFTLVSVQVPDTGLSDEQCRIHAAAAIKQLAPNIDAFWISDIRGLHSRHMPDILTPLLENRVYTWSPSGPNQVRRGVLMGMPEVNYAEHGRFHARVMAAVFHGARPRDLPQELIATRTLQINRVVAQRIGFALPGGLLSVAGMVHDHIERTAAGDPSR
jgi:ABC-type uncharacterized transport system substrate-binding protein